MSPLKHFPSVSRRRLLPRELPSVYRALRMRFGHQHWWPGDTPFEIMIGAILTQNTAWTNVEKAIRRLKKAGLLTPAMMRATARKKLAALIRPAGYFNIKTDRLGHFLDFLYREYGGDLRRMRLPRGDILREKLLEVKGIGPETADSMLLYALGKPFFVIDAYTRRIFSRHRLFDFDADYDEWQALITHALPRKTSLYNDFHAQIVFLGKQYCKASKVCCQDCPLRQYL